MTEPKDFFADIGSNAHENQKRVLFVTRRSSAQVKSVDEEQVQTYPEALFRAAIAIELLFIALLIISLLFDAPLEGIADPTNTPNPAKAPWYFLGLQELLHYFPPVVAGVLMPTLLIIALVVIPYFNIIIDTEGVFLTDRKHRLHVFYIAAAGLSVFLWIFHVYVALVPTLIVTAVMLVAAFGSRESSLPLQHYLVSKPLSWWIMTWFLIELVVLTAVGTFFRGPGWSWIWPWRN